MIATIEELDRVREETRALVTKRSLVSAGAAVIPVPGIDLVADIKLLSDLLPEISQRFELAEDHVKKLDPNMAQQVLVLASSLGNNVIGRAVTKRVVVAILKRMGVRVATGSVAKFVPFIGSGVAAGISFAAMRAAGLAHVEDCYNTARAMIEPGTRPR